MESYVIYSNGECKRILSSSAFSGRSNICTFGFESIVYFNSDVACSFPLQDLDFGRGDIPSSGCSVAAADSSRHIFCVLECSGRIVLFRNVMNGTSSQFIPWISSPLTSQILSHGHRIIEIAVGDMHVLFRTSSGNVFSLGNGNNNYCIFM